jgi:glycosyltransferase involved in cell wall biosynthesis
VNVLILHQHYKTPGGGGAIRSYYLSRALVEKGHQAVVVTTHNKAQYQKVNEDGAEVHYLPVSYDNRFSFYARGWSFMKFIAQAIRLTRSFKNIELVYAISVPITVAWIAQWIKWRKKIPYVFEVGDLWPDAPIQLGFVQNYFLRQFLFSLERSAYQNARSVVALSPAIQSQIQKKIPGKRVDVIPNMADCDFYQPTEKPSSTLEKLNIKGKFVVSYIGAIGFANGLDYFLECANAARKANLSIHFIICGDGALLDRLKNNARQLGLTNDESTGTPPWLTFVPFTNREGVREIMRITDASFVSYKNVPILETGSPNKYFDGLAAGKLIITNFGGWIRKDIEENRCGFYCDPREPVDFIKKITPFLEDPKLLKQYQQAARTLAEKNYSRVLLSDKWLKLIEASRPGN